MGGAATGKRHISIVLPLAAFAYLWLPPYYPNSVVFMLVRTVSENIPIWAVVAEWQFWRRLNRLPQGCFVFVECVVGCV